MVRSLIFSCCLFLFPFAIARADLQLTPSVDEYLLEGVKFKQLAFFDGGQKVTYQSPHGWNYSGTATQLTLYPPNKVLAEATIARVPEPSQGKFDDETVKKLVAEAVASIPKGSANVVVESQERAPLRIGNRETLLVVIGYDALGSNFTRSILFINRGAEQIRCQLTCRTTDFRELQKAFLGSQYTWRNL
jgi:hypothetical protein